MQESTRSLSNFSIYHLFYHDCKTESGNKKKEVDVKRKFTKQTGTCQVNLKDLIDDFAKLEALGVYL